MKQLAQANAWCRLTLFPSGVTDDSLNQHLSTTLQMKSTWSKPGWTAQLSLCLIHSISPKCMMLHSSEWQLSLPEASFSSFTPEAMMRTSVFHPVLTLCGGASTFFVVVQWSQVHNIAWEPWRNLTDTDSLSWWSEFLHWCLLHPHQTCQQASLVC